MKYVVYLFWTVCMSIRAQNLISNGDFENFVFCPTGSAQFNAVVNWGNAQSSTSPDYFNSCSGTNSNVPFTVFGYQNDCIGGGGIAGIYTFNRGFPNQARDYIQTELNDTLKNGRKYLASMYVNACDVYNYAVASLDMYFTTGAVQGPTNYAFMNVPNPQVKNNLLLKDTMNWLLIQDTIRGMGERYLTIGNFSYDSLSDTNRVYNMGFGTSNDNAYYYIDGVSVYDVTSAACNTYWDAGFDKYIFKGDSIRLGAINTDNSTYVWQNSAGGNTFLSGNTDARPWASPTVTTTYYVNKTCPNNNIFIDTVTVVVTDTNSVGINQFTGNKIETKIFPNPNDGFMTIEYSINENSILEITDVSGKLVGSYTLPVSSHKIQITSNDLQDGIYIYKVLSSNSILKMGKMAVMK